MLRVRILQLFITISFFFQIEETCTFMNINLLLDISPKSDIKAENSSTYVSIPCIIHEGRKGLRPMGSNADRLKNHVEFMALILLLHRHS